MNTISKALVTALLKYGYKPVECNSHLRCYSMKLHVGILQGYEFDSGIIMEHYIWIKRGRLLGAYGPYMCFSIYMDGFRKLLLCR